MKWISMSKRKPEDGQLCLTEMKHGMIEGIYNADEDEFSGYYWHDITWTAYYWVPSDEIQELLSPNGD